MLAELNPQQLAAATHPPREGALLVLAGAGCGKTLTLAARMAWLVQQGADPNRLLLLSFSRRAARHLEHRAGLMLQQALGLPPESPRLRLPWCGTFHSVAARLLREQASALGLAAGFTVLDPADAQELLHGLRQRGGLAAAEPGEGGMPGASRFPLAPTCAAILSRAVNTRSEPAAVLQQAYPWCRGHEPALLQLFAAYAQAKRAQQALDYDDLLLAWRQLMRDPGFGSRLRQRWDHVLVDEVQDLNPLQYEIVELLRPQGLGLTVVGDDAQAIYGFRGADLQQLLSLPQRCQPPARVLGLQRSYRATQPLLDLANALVAQAAQGFRQPLWSPREDGPRPQLHSVEDEAAQASAVVDTVLCAREGGLPLKQQAVLFRTGTHSQALELELARRQVPFVKFGGLRFTEAAHVKDLLSLLRWADNPAAQLAAQRVARLLPGMGAASVARLLQHEAAGLPLQQFQPPPAARQAWAALLTLLLQLRHAPCWPQELQQVLAWYTPLCERLHADARVRIGQLQQLLKLAASQPDRARFASELAIDPPAATGDEAGRPLLDEDWLVLSTIHSAKGQEWSAVHVLNLVDGCMPADLATGSAAEIEEERRLLYVACTRAREQLHLWVPLRFHVTQQASGGGRHLYAPVSRFMTPQAAACCDASAWPLQAAARVAGLPGPPSAYPENVGAAPQAGAPGPAFDLAAALARPWT